MAKQKKVKYSDFYSDESSDDDHNSSWDSDNYDAGTSLLRGQALTILPKLSTNGRNLKRHLRGCVLIPYRWSRRLTEDLNDDGPLVYYCSPSGRVLRSMGEVSTYMSELNSCQCYLAEDMKLADTFNFDPAISGLALPPPARIKELRPRCLHWHDKVSPRAALQMRTKVERTMRPLVTSCRAEIKRILSRSIANQHQVTLQMSKFDWNKVDVLKDGRVYLREVNESQWQHRLFEWKNSSCEFVRVKTRMSAAEPIRMETEVEKEESEEEEVDDEVMEVPVEESFRQAAERTAVEVEVVLKVEEEKKKVLRSGKNVVQEKASNLSSSQSFIISSLRLQRANPLQPTLTTSIDASYDKTDEDEEEDKEDNDKTDRDDLASSGDEVEISDNFVPQTRATRFSAVFNQNDARQSISTPTVSSASLVGKRKCRQRTVLAPISDNDEHKKKQTSLTPQQPLPQFRKRMSLLPQDLRRKSPRKGPKSPSADDIIVISSDDEEDVVEPNNLNQTPKQQPPQRSTPFVSKQANSSLPLTPATLNLTPNMTSAPTASSSSTPAVPATSQPTPKKRKRRSRIVLKV